MTDHEYDPDLPYVAVGPGGATWARFATHRDALNYVGVNPGMSLIVLKEAS